MDLEEALRKLAEKDQQLTQANEKLKQYEGIDPEQANRDRQSLSDQLANTQRQFNEYKQATTQQIEALTADFNTQLNQKDVAFNFSSALGSAGVLPEYRDRFGDVAGSLKFEHGKLLNADGSEFNTSSLREKYPAMFAAVGDGAGSGATGSTTAPTTQGTKTVKAENGVITGVDPADMIGGKVVIGN